MIHTVTLLLLYFTSLSTCTVLVQVYDEDTLTTHLSHLETEKIQSVYAFGDFYGYTYDGNYEEYGLWLNKNGVDGWLGFEEDQTMEAMVCQSPCPWHLKAITGDLKWGGCPFDDRESGQGAMVYILDQYADIHHKQFEGRLEAGPAFVGRPIGQEHGTHVAGLIGSQIYALAKKVRMKTVGVLSAEGSGSYSALLNAIQFVFRDSSKYRNRTIVNLSLGGPYSQIVNEAVNTLVTKAGIVVVVAAGNSAEDACRGSPGSARMAITVGSMGSNYQFSTFSNFGKCVDIVAPGEAILSTLPNQGQGYMTGTSMAAPLVASRFALELSREPTTPDIAWSRVFVSMQRDRLRQLPPQTPNRNVYVPPLQKCP